MLAEYRARVREEEESQCRRCEGAEETIEHVLVEFVE